MPLRRMARGRVAGMCWWPNTLPHLARVSGRTHGRDVWGQTQRHQVGKWGDTRCVTCPRARARTWPVGPAGCGAARGTRAPRGCAACGRRGQSRSARGRGPRRAAVGTDTEVWSPPPHWAVDPRVISKVSECRNQRGDPGLCTCQPWLEPGGGTASHQRQGPCRQVSASEKSHGGRVPTAGPRGRRPPGGTGRGGTV